MISLKRFLDGGRNDERVETLERVVQLLLQGFSLHSIQGAPDDYATFQSSIQQVCDSIKTARDPKDYLVLSGAAIRTIEDYQRRTVRYLSRLRAEMQRMISMLTASISTISEASNESLNRLKDIENQMKEAAELDDVRQVKARLSECLEDIRRERDRQRKHSSKAVADLGEALAAARAGMEAAEKNSETTSCDFSAQLDSVTGLPGRAAAEAAIERECLSLGSSQIVVIILDNLSAINLRYGRSVGDEVLQAFGDCLAQLLPPEDELFRWDGPALLVLSRSPERPDRIRERFAKMLEKKFEHSIQTASRDTTLSVTTRWAVLQLLPIARAVFQKIDLFVSPLNDTPLRRG